MLQNTRGTKNSSHTSKTSSKVPQGEGKAAYISIALESILIVFQNARKLINSNENHIEIPISICQVGKNSS